MENEFSYILTGSIFGLSGGLTPGPLMTLVISETLKHGTREGLKIAIVPVISDLPIVVGSLLVVSSLSEAELLLGILALAGAAYLIHLGLENMRFKGKAPDSMNSVPQSFKKGIITNLLNPNPYMFWITVGAPTVLLAGQVDPAAPVLFVFFMYLCLVGSKIITAVIVGKSRNFLVSRGYIYTIRVLGALLILFALSFIWQAAGMLFFK